MKLDVKVTEKHINNGRPVDECFCPIALALKDMGCRVIGVYQNRAYFEIDHEAYAADLPAEAQSFVFRFDNDGDVAPFDFSIYPS